MRGRVPWILGVVVLAAGLARVSPDKVNVQRVYAGTPKSDVGMEWFPVEPGTVFTRVDAYAEGAEPSTTAGAGQVLIYDNTLGQIAVNIGTQLVTDDIGTIGAPGCRVERIVFPVTGRVNPTGVGGAYTVDFALYSACPGSVPGTNPVIPGTQGQLIFPDDAARLVNFSLPGTGIAVNPNIWFGVKFSRTNAGVLVGSPASTGATCDSFDFPGFACAGALGGFPDRPHASFNVQLFGDATTCTHSFDGYKNIRASGPIYNLGQDTTLVDDIQLGVPSCQMIGYEVAVKGLGFFQFDMRRNCEGSIIAGSEKVYNGTGNTVQIARFGVTPPVALPENLFFATKVNNPQAGIIVSGVQACVGSTEDVFLQPGATDCAEKPFPDPVIHDAVNLTIICAGDPPVGACCDMYFRDENNEAVCRQVPEMNCPFPPRQSPEFRPPWVSGAECDPDPFDFPCGQAACCNKPGNLAETCDNLTLNECNAIEPLDRPRQWQIGRKCGAPGQHCPLNACLERAGDCLIPHLDPGCEDSTCCDRVCRGHGPDGIYCCQVEWDSLCTEFAAEDCDIPPPNDVCAPNDELEGALLLTLSNCFKTEITGALKARESTVESPNPGNPPDPGFGCYIDNPGAQGKQTVWYKFVAGCTHTRVTTCSSNSPANDSLLALYAVGDMTNEATQCNSLIPIGCSDDALNCGPLGKNSSLCARTVPGELYYIQVASKVPITTDGGFRVTITDGGQNNCNPPLNNDFCPFGTPVGDGVRAFDFTPAQGTFTLDGPFDGCIPTVTADMWYDYTASCTGTVTVETCGSGNPDTNLSIYDSDAEGECICPTALTPNLACSADALACGPASRLHADVVAGNCYKIRLGDSAESLPEGNLTIGCEQADCPAGTVEFISPLEGTVDAGRPHQPNNASAPLGIQTIVAEHTAGALPSCWSLCETAINGGANSIASVVESPAGRYTITLARPITAGAKTAVKFTSDGGSVSQLHLTSHPANVNDDGFASLGDLTALVQALEGIFALPHGNYSGDLDRSGLVTPADLVEGADLLVGAMAYDPWNGTANQKDNPLCP